MHIYYYYSPLYLMSQGYTNVPVRFQDYISCAEIWVEFTCRHFTVSHSGDVPALCKVIRSSGALFQTLFRFVV